MSKATILRVLAAVVAVATALSAGVLAVANDLPNNWRPDAVLAVTVLGLVVVAVKAIEAELQSQSLASNERIAAQAASTQVSLAVVAAQPPPPVVPPPVVPTPVAVVPPPGTVPPVAA
jgi:hypothetical protein